MHIPVTHTHYRCTYLSNTHTTDAQSWHTHTTDVTHTHTHTHTTDAQTCHTPTTDVTHTLQMHRLATHTLQMHKLATHTHYRCTDHHHLSFHHVDKLLHDKWLTNFPASHITTHTPSLTHCPPFSKLGCKWLCHWRVTSYLCTSVFEITPASLMWSAPSIKFEKSWSTKTMEVTVLKIMIKHQVF